MNIPIRFQICCLCKNWGDMYRDNAYCEIADEYTAFNEHCGYWEDKVDENDDQ